MKQNRFWITTTMALGLLAGGQQALGQAMATLPAPAVDTGNVRMWTGGVGKDESDAMRKAAPQYPLALMMSESKRGHYVSGVALRIVDKDGRQVVDHAFTGPLVLLQLPEGRYRVEARHDGRTLTRNVAVGKRHRMLHLNWPASD